MQEFKNEVKEFWKSLNKFYFCNFVLLASLVFSVMTAFVVQFKVESLQDEMAQTQMQIASYKDRIALLEVEWTYLTRPARLRTLASNYLKGNGYTLASQITTNESLEKAYAEKVEL